MPNYKESSLYYWLVLVLRQSIVETIQFPRLMGKLQDAILWLTLFILISLGLLQTGQFPQFPLNWNVLVASAGILLVARLVQGILSIPPRLFFAVKNENKDLRNRYETPNPPCPLVITQYQEQPNHRRVGIKIENPLANQKISHLRVILDTLTLCSPDGERIQKTIDDADRGFPNGVSFEPGGAINPTQYVVVFFANVAPNYMILELAQSCEFHDLTHLSTDESMTAPMVADYELQFSVSGFVGDRPFRKSTFVTRVHVESHFDDTRPLPYGGWQITMNMIPPEQLAR